MGRVGVGGAYHARYAFCLNSTVRRLITGRIGARRTILESWGKRRSLTGLDAEVSLDGRRQGWLPIQEVGEGEP
jgi:hypothetical protein